MTVKKTNHDFFPGAAVRRGKKIDWKSLNRTVQWRTDVGKKKKESALRSALFVKNLAPCPICGGGAHRQFVEIYGYRYSECASCGHIFMNPLLDSDAIAKLYKGGEKGSVQKLIYMAGEKLFKDRIKQIAVPKVSYCNSLIKGRGLWVDIGCGSGELLVAARKSGWTVKGFEPDVDEADFAERHGLGVVRGYITAENSRELKDAKIISLINVLEHIGDPVSLLKNAVRNLKPGAYVALEVPHHPALSSFVNLVFPASIYQRHIFPPDHLHAFTDKSARIMLDKAGVRAVGVWQFGQDAFDFILGSLVNAGIQESEFTGKILGLAPDIQKIVDKNNLSDTMFLVAKKI